MQRWPRRDPLARRVGLPHPKRSTAPIPTANRVRSTCVFAEREWKASFFIDTIAYASPSTRGA